MCTFVPPMPCVPRLFPFALELASSSSSSSSSIRRQQQHASLSLSSLLFPRTGNSKSYLSRRRRPQVPSLFPFLPEHMVLPTLLSLDLPSEAGCALQKVRSRPLEKQHKTCLHQAPAAAAMANEARKTKRKEKGKRARGFCCSSFGLTT